MTLTISPQRLRRLFPQKFDDLFDNTPQDQESRQYSLDIGHAYKTVSAINERIHNCMQFNTEISSHEYWDAWTKLEDKNVKELFTRRFHDGLSDRAKMDPAYHVIKLDLQRVAPLQVIANDLINPLTLIEQIGNNTYPIWQNALMESTLCLVRRGILDVEQGMKRVERAGFDYLLPALERARTGKLITGAQYSASKRTVEGMYKHLGKVCPPPINLRERLERAALEGPRASECPAEAPVPSI